MKSRYTKEHIDFLRVGYPAMKPPELTRAFNVRFETALSESQITAACKNRKIKSGRQKGHPKGTYRLFTKEQAQFLQTNYSRCGLTDLTAEFNSTFCTELTVGQVRSFIHNHGVISGRTGRFEKGRLPWNAGSKGKGLTGPNGGTFLKGNAPPNRKPLGSERRDKGYIQIKVAEKDPYTGFPTRYRAKHVVVWEREHGPVPEGMVVAFIDGNDENCGPANLMLINRAELLRLNQHKYRELPDDLKPSVLALAKLEVKTFSLSKDSRGG